MCSVWFVVVVVVSVVVWVCVGNGNGDGDGDGNEGIEVAIKSEAKGISIWILSGRNGKG
jgi:hypothetical protein